MDKFVIRYTGPDADFFGDRTATTAEEATATRDTLNETMKPEYQKWEVFELVPLVMVPENHARVAKNIRATAERLGVVIMQSEANVLAVAAMNAIEKQEG